MENDELISWLAPEHLAVDKTSDWYWAVAIISLAIIAVCFIFAQIITGLLFIASITALVIHASLEPKVRHYTINDRGIAIDGVLYPFLSLESFWIPHDEWPPRLLIKSHKHFMPLIVIYIDGISPEAVREVMGKYIAETEHHESFLKKLLEKFGF